MDQTRQTLLEGLRYQDMVNQVVPEVGVDEYKAQIGDDDDIVTLNFTVKSKACADDLADWFERGYDWVVDAESSDGELSPQKWMVFVEMNRRRAVPERIVELCHDLKTLTEIDNDEWVVHIQDEDYPLDAEVLKHHIITSPHQYRQEKEGQLNEWREIAGIQTVSTYDDDAEIKQLKHRAGM